MDKMLDPSDPFSAAGKAENTQAQRRVRSGIDHMSGSDSMVLTPEEAGEAIHPLHYAAAMGDKKTVTSILAQFPNPADLAEQVNQRDAFGRTALVYAVVADRAPIVEILLKMGTDVNAKDRVSVCVKERVCVKESVPV